MNMNYKKSLKLMTLLITSMLIAIASVAAYNEMFMYATPISIGTASVQFTDGDDTSAISTLGITSAGTEVTFDNIASIQPGETRTYEEAVNITNTSGSTKTINISLVSLTGQFSENFEYLNITMLDKDDNIKGNIIRIVSSGDNVTETTGQQIDNNAEWRIRWIIKAKVDATQSESISVTFKVKVE